MLLATCLHGLTQAAGTRCDADGLTADGDMATWADQAAVMNKNDSVSCLQIRLFLIPWSCLEVLFHKIPFSPISTIHSLPDFIIFEEIIKNFFNSLWIRPIFTIITLKQSYFH